MTKCPALIKIGTRKSPLAVAQAIEVKNRLLGAFPELTQSQIELVKMQTTGDRIQDRHLAEIGGKGLFTKEIEEALYAEEVDIAVHSMKDMPDTMPNGLIIPCILEREDPRDAFISTKYSSIADLPQGATIGTSSVRRQAQLLSIRPDLNITEIRGNVQTRLTKLERGDVDGTFLAVAGLKRLDMQHHITEAISVADMLPAVAQGAIGVECLIKNQHIQEVISKINHEESNVRVTAERGFLKALNGSCSTPIAALCTYQEDGSIILKGMVADIKGHKLHTVERTGQPWQAWDIGADAGEELLAKYGDLLH